MTSLMDFHRAQERAMREQGAYFRLMGSGLQQAAPRPAPKKPPEDKSNLLLLLEDN